MARFPGTESHQNRAGLRPGQAVRCRRSQANADRGMADRRGFLAEVRQDRVCVLHDADGRSIWLENVDVLPEPLPSDHALSPLHEAYTCLGGHRLEFEEGVGISIFSEGFPAERLEALREHLGNRLLGLEVAAFGVHELAVHLRLSD